MFAADLLLTVINLIYKNLFNHQAFDGLSIIISTIKIVCKKRNISLDNMVTTKVQI